MKILKFLGIHPNLSPAKIQNKIQAIEDAKDDLMTFDSLLFENLD